MKVKQLSKTKSLKKLKQQISTDGINKAYLGVLTRPRLTAYLIFINQRICRVVQQNVTSTAIIFVSLLCVIKDARYI